MTVKNRFTDPATGNSYDWTFNQAWEGDQRSGAHLNLTFTSSTAGAALPQIGELQQETMTLSGTILRREQHEAFIEWAQLCRTQTIYFTDHDSDDYEVVIVSYSWRRQGVGLNPSDPGMPFHIYRYELVMAIVDGGVA